MPADNPVEARSAERGWDEHNLSKLRYFRSLRLREKLQALEGMADVVRHFQQIRAQGGFKARSEQADESHVTCASGSPQVADPLLETDNIAHGLETSRRTVAQAAPKRAATHPSGSDPAQGGPQHGLRGGAGGREDAGSRTRAPAARIIRYVETTLGIQSYAELAPHLALHVQNLEADIADGRSSNWALGEDLILAFHQRICGDLMPGMAGRWRRVDVRVGDHEAQPYPHVPMLMRDYCRDLEARITTLAGTLDDRTLECLAFAEGRLLWVRAFLARILRRLDVPAVDPTPEAGQDSERYRQALRAADRADWGPLVTVWRERFEKEAGARTHRPDFRRPKLTAFLYSVLEQ